MLKAYIFATIYVHHFIKNVYKIIVKKFNNKIVQNIQDISLEIYIHKFNYQFHSLIKLI